MATASPKAGAIQAATQSQAAKPTKTIRDYIERMQSEIARALPTAITPERFTRMVLSAISANPDLAKCTQESFLGAMMLAAQLGLEPNTPLGQAYLIPYRNNSKGITECQFQLGYKGFIDLAYRSGEIQSIQAQVVYQNDEFSYAYGLDPKLDHRPAMKDRGDPIYVYAVFRTVRGGYGFQVMSIDDIRRHAAKYSKAYSSSFSPWKTNFEEMAKKTVLKAVLKYAPLKSEFVLGYQQDGAVHNAIKSDMAEEVANSVLEGDFTGEILDVEAEEPLPFEGSPSEQPESEQTPL